MGTVLAIVIIAWVGVLLVWALRRRSAAMRTMHGPLGGGDPTARPPGSAADISDGGQVPANELFGALRIAEVAELDSEGEPNDLAGLGLKLHEGSTGSSSGQTQIARGRPQVMEGKRNGHQVFIRQGHIGDGLGLSVGFRKERHITTVRVSAPDFELRADEGTLAPSAGAPGEVMGVLADLSPAPDVWHEQRIVGGPKGMVASRGSSSDYLGGWIYDLWLLERIAAKLRANPLDDVRLTRDWTPPYGMADWAPSALETLRGSG